MVQNISSSPARWSRNNWKETHHTVVNLTSILDDHNDDYSTEESEPVNGNFVFARIPKIPYLNSDRDSIYLLICLKDKPIETRADDISKSSAFSKQNLGEEIFQLSGRIGRIRQISNTIKEIEQLRNLNDGWAGEGSIAPSEETIADALSFLAMLPDFAPAPTVTPADDGEIVLEWFSKEKRAVASFEGDGRFGYALVINGNFRPGAEEGIIENYILPDDLIGYLQSMTEL